MLETMFLQLMGERNIYIVSNPIDTDTLTLMCKEYTYIVVFNRTIYKAVSTNLRKIIELVSLGLVTIENLDIYKNRDNG